MPRIRPLALAALAVIVCAAAPAGARTWRVPLDAPTIRAGVDSAAAGDTVLVACGTWLEHDIPLKGGVTLRGETGDPACVTVDAGQLGRVFDCTGQSGRAVVEGLRITGGRTPDGWLEAMGGGIRCQDSSLRVARCILAGNAARIGAGLGVYRSAVEIDSCVITANAATHHEWAAGGGLWVRESSGTLSRSTIADNTAFSTPSGNPGDGGGLFCNNTRLVVTDCLFLGNATGAGAGGFYSLTADAAALRRCRFEDNTAAWGGAAYFEFGSRATVDSCSFVANTALSGGALLVDPGCAPVLQDCLFAGNRATLGDGGAAQCWGSGPTFRRCRFEGNTSASEGGALFLGGATPVVDQCLFAGNTAAQRGGAVHYQGTTATLARSTFDANAAPAGGAVSLVAGSRATLARCILAFATQGAAAAADGTSLYVAVSCTDAYGNAGGDWVGPLAAWDGVDGNLAADPLFLAAAAGDYRLACASPCASRQAGACGLIGAFPDDCAPTSVPGDGAAAPAPLQARVAPNPFNARVSIAFAAPAPGPARVTIHAPDGRRVRALVDGVLPAGPHVATWDGRDDGGAPVASGAYLCRVEAGGLSVTRKLSLVK